MNEEEQFIHGNMALASFALIIVLSAFLFTSNNYYSTYDIVGFSTLDSTVTDYLPTPTGLKVSAIWSSAVTLKWEPVEGVHTGYIIYKNGVIVGATRGTVFTVMHLLPGNEYSFQVATFQQRAPKRSESPLSEAVKAKTWQLCTDTDFPRQFTQRGATSQGVNNTDYCKNDKVLVEYYCDRPDTNGKTESIEFECPLGCSEGACKTPSEVNPVVCVDSDNGKTPLIRGRIKINNSDKEPEDTCASPVVLNEVFCEGNRPNVAPVNCEFGCKEGACLPREPLPPIQLAKDKPKLTFENQMQNVAPGSTVTLSWNSVDATSCLAGGSWTGIKSASGSEQVRISTSSRFVLVCAGAGGVSDVKVVEVAAVQ